MKFINVVLIFISISFISYLYAIDKTLTIIHTNDLHSHIIGDNISGKSIGGYSRIATVINNEKKNNSNPVIVLDAGDFLTGPVPYKIFRNRSSILGLMKKMKYNVITLGNHDFDVTPIGLAEIINLSRKKEAIPNIVISNIKFCSIREEDDALEKIYKKNIIQRYIVLNKKEIKIGIFAILGNHASKIAIGAKPITFKDPTKTSIEVIKDLREKKNVDIVICLSHSGIKTKNNIGEDEALAKNVNGIDIIVGGHTHSKLEKPIVINNTIIVQAWEFGKQLGVLHVKINKSGVELLKYKVVEINDSIIKNKTIDKAIKLLLNK